MTSWTYERHCAEIVVQADLAALALVGRDLTLDVPSCPGWNVGQLARHLGGALRWTADTILDGGDQPPPDDHFRDLTAYADEDPTVVGPWLAESGRVVARALREVGPDARVWVPDLGLDPTPRFQARRMTHETAIHRADAELALGLPYVLDPEVAVDGIDEWLTLTCLPTMLDLVPQRRDVLGAGRSVHLHATDVAEGAEWVVDLGGPTMAWRQAHEKSTVALRGPVTDLLLCLYRRRRLDEGDAEVLGDRGLLEEWLEVSAFG